MAKKGKKSAAREALLRAQPKHYTKPKEGHYGRIHHLGRRDQCSGLYLEEVVSVSTKYKVEVRELVWRIDAGGYYALVLATSATEAAGKATDLERKGQLSSEFQNIDRVSGPWERNNRQLIAG